uniref:Uncharacterized protein n=1 Tax=Sphaerodactylus townsendi TaxID=933632 RepID=A0ACB8FXE7_9SAUR
MLLKKVGGSQGRGVCLRGVGERPTEFSQLPSGKLRKGGKYLFFWPNLPPSPASCLQEVVWTRTPLPPASLQYDLTRWHTAGAQSGLLACSFFKKKRMHTTFAPQKRQLPGLPCACGGTTVGGGREGGGQHQLLPLPISPLERWEWDPLMPLWGTCANRFSSLIDGPQLGPASEQRLPPCSVNYEGAKARGRGGAAALSLCAHAWALQHLGALGVS